MATKHLTFIHSLIDILYTEQFYFLPFHFLIPLCCIYSTAVIMHETLKTPVIMAA